MNAMKVAESTHRPLLGIRRRHTPPPRFSTGCRVEQRGPAAQYQAMDRGGWSRCDRLDRRRTAIDEFTVCQLHLGDQLGALALNCDANRICHVAAHVMPA